MPFAILLFIYLVFVVVIWAGSAGAGNRNALIRNGLLARGLVLQASSTSSGEMMYLGQRFERRWVTLDIEVPGRAPYELSTTPMFPRICEALPGATLDVRVDPKNPNNIAVVGPAGSSAWLGAAALVPGQTWAGPQARIGNVLPKGCGLIIVVLIGMSLAFASLLSFISDARKPHTPSSTHTTVPTHPTPRVPPKTNHPH